MTHRLYYTDAYTLAFDAQVRSIDATGTRVVLDRTAFYPTSGGQPFDTGTLDVARVVDVVEDDDTGDIVHILATPTAATPGTAVIGTVDEARRRDHREQHTAQHLLSAIAADTFGWETVSVHFGADRSLIEFAVAEATPEQLATLEQQADAVARAPKAVTVGFEDAAAALGLRKPPTRDGEIRVVTIEGIDRSACGGTHVRSTAEVLPIVLRGTERLRGRVRVGFLAGQRAISRAAEDARLLAQIATQLTCAPAEVPDAIVRLTVRAGELENERRRLRTQLASVEARALWETAHIGSDGVRALRIAQHALPLEDVKPLVQALVALGGVRVCATSESPLGVLFAVSSDVPTDCGRALREALVAVGGRGGGNAAQAQGTVPSVDALTDVVSRLGFGT
ncbi:MAG: alanine--tRNA ligase-related protein [Gemmatimonadaceae bacterium]|nr:alanine--tRNA ligase-related protein [Gemmatimonadaceae bacterium]